ncbi:VCBS repeat-containing protein [Streptomyces sp. NPDC048188]|uniref:VCBS repeat-containing protein n=1 Tax=Streptomyces sp. NPDC048188 TaxID=3155749 RepID=UPI00343B3C78
MPHARPSGRRFAAAVTVVLAVTAGLTGTTGPAEAAPTAPAVSTAVSTVHQAGSESVAAFPVGHAIEGVTESGYLTKGPATSALSWVRASDGAVTALPDGPSVSPTGAGDLLAMNTGSEAWLQDAADGGQLFKVLFKEGGGTGAYTGAAGRALFSTAARPEGGVDLRMHTEGDVTSTVIGFPRGFRSFSVTPGTSAHAVLTYRALTDTGSYEDRWALIDLATGTITETGRRENIGTEGVAVSPSHVAWVEHGTTETSAVVRTRSTGETRRIPLGDQWTGNLRIGLQGDHLIYGLPGGAIAKAPKALFALTAYDLTTGARTKLLDHVTSTAVSPDGVFHARGGTVAQGEGLYRVDAGTDGGAPSASLVASTGEPTSLTLVGHDIPEVIDLSHGGGRSLAWTLSRSNASITASLRHVRTGKTETLQFYGPMSANFTTSWHGTLDDSQLTAYNGDYEWEMSARPLNGIGPALTASGTFKVVRSPVAPHDFNDNGTPDLLARDTSGRMWRSDSHAASYEGENKLVGGGWNAYDRIEATGDVGGAATGDLVARDKSGVLWLYLGKGDGTFATRTRIGGGWGVYDQIAAGSDLTGDGRADLLATDKNGVLWLYRSTGDWRSPFTAPTRVGGGWNVYDQLTATGDIGGAASGDLVARDKAGVLWLYLGKGDGTFATRTRIGTGWDIYRYTVGIGDADRDGRPDLFAYTDYGTYYYPGTGDWRSPFGTRESGSLPVTDPVHTAVL